MREVVNSTMIYLIYCNNFCKFHNVSPPNTTVKNLKIKKKVGFRCINTFRETQNVNKVRHMSHPKFNNSTIKDLNDNMNDISSNELKNNDNDDQKINDNIKTS
jgi:hypothetical protein